MIHHINDAKQFRPLSNLHILSQLQGFNSSLKDDTFRQQYFPFKRHPDLKLGFLISGAQVQEPQRVHGHLSCQSSLFLALRHIESAAFGNTSRASFPAEMSVVVFHLLWKRASMF